MRTEDATVKQHQRKKYPAEPFAPLYLMWEALLTTLLFKKNVKREKDEIEFYFSYKKISIPFAHFEIFSFSFPPFHKNER